MVPDRRLNDIASTPPERRIMADQPINPIIQLSEDEASRILTSWLVRPVMCRGVRRLTGGCVNTVVRADYEDGEVVIKLSQELEDTRLEKECEVLRHFESVPAFRVPRLLHRDMTGKTVPYSYFIMEYLPGVNLADAGGHMDDRDRAQLEQRIGESVARLHEKERETFGHCADHREYTQWSECFLNRFDRTILEIEAGELLDSKVLDTVKKLRDTIPHFLDTAARPVLTHGDIWATNIILSPDSFGWSLVGFVDPGGLYAHPEYELAYLDMWNTVGRTFHDVYRSSHEVEPGYELRRFFYWLHTLLIHVRAFKTDYYRTATASLASQMNRLIRKKG